MATERHIMNPQTFDESVCAGPDLSRMADMLRTKHGWRETDIATLVVALRRGIREEVDANRARRTG
jgi:hypothetical protein